PDDSAPRRVHQRLQLRDPRRLRRDPRDGGVQPRRGPIPDRRGHVRPAMSDLKTRLGEAVSAAFAAEGLPAELGRVTPSDRPDLADFQCNGALAAAKAARANPREIAGRIVARLADLPLIESADIAGPGFINLKVTAPALAERAAEVAADPRAGAAAVAEPRKVVIDYGGPNVAKPMHVGHLRSSIIGESLKRRFRF